MRRIVVGHSGGVTSAWSLGWALNFYPREEVVALWHDTKKEDGDTLRFLFEIADKLGVSVTERSDGRSVDEVEDDEGALANNRMAFCSRILKADQKDRYFKELRNGGIQDIVSVVGFSAWEWQRIQRGTAFAKSGGYSIRFPVAETWPAKPPPKEKRGRSLREWIDSERSKSKQFCADWCISLGVRPPRIYQWSEHANCVGCRRGGKAYWLNVKENRPDVFLESVQREKDFGHTFLNGTSLEQLAVTGLKRKIKQRESIDIGACECGG